MFYADRDVKTFCAWSLAILDGHLRRFRHANSSLSQMSARFRVERRSTTRQVITLRQSLLPLIHLRKRYHCQSLVLNPA